MSIFDDHNLIFAELTPKLLSRSFNFSCGEQDLDEFFNKDVFVYREKLMGKTYCFVRKENDDYEIIVAFTVANDSLKVSDLPSSRKNKIAKIAQKHLKRYPGVLIGRLGVNKNYQNKNFGSKILTYIKHWFTEPNNKQDADLL